MVILDRTVKEELFCISENSCGYVAHVSAVYLRPVLQSRFNICRITFSYATK